MVLFPRQLSLLADQTEIHFTHCHYFPHHYPPFQTTESM